MTLFNWHCYHHSSHDSHAWTLIDLSNSNEFGFIVVQCRRTTDCAWNNDGAREVERVSQIKRNYQLRQKADLNIWPSGWIWEFGTKQLIILPNRGAIIDANELILSMHLNAQQKGIERDGHTTNLNGNGVPNAQKPIHTHARRTHPYSRTPTQSKQFNRFNSSQLLHSRWSDAEANEETIFCILTRQHESGAFTGLHSK